MTCDYDSIPEELRWTKQWLVAGLDSKGAPKVPNTLTSKGLRLADPTKLAQCLDFETARDFVEANPSCGLGFVVSASDQYVCVDLDIKNATNLPHEPAKWTSGENLNRFRRIIEAFASYTEKSTGGQGYHIWVKGAIGAGVRRDGVEIYSQDHFLTCTGNVVNNKPIEERQELLNSLLAELRKGQAPILTLVDNEQTESDETVIQRAASAENGTKFQMLALGDWAALGYPSQSEADAAMLTMLAFYTKSNSQVFRIFRMCQLGRREKATKNDYYLSVSLRKVRSIAANEQTNSDIGQRIAQTLLQRLAQTKLAAAGHAAPAATQIHGPAPWPPHVAIPPASGANPQIGRGNIHALNLPPILPPIEANTLPPISSHSLEYPPGWTGELAKHIFSSSPRPIREVSIVAALGLMAGVLGKAFCIPQSGLNLYIILVGQSAIGKEAMHSGISSLMKKASNASPACSGFADFADYVSAPALTKAVAASPSFVNVCGEFGRKLQRMAADDRGDTVMQQLRTVMTNLYQKSGPGSMFGGLGYSDKDKNIASVSGVAYSMIGETTPGTFYDSLTDSMMADGFLSRFTIVEYVGQRPPQNENLTSHIPDHILGPFVDMCVVARSRNDGVGNAVLVETEHSAEEFLKTFDKHCDKEINRTQNEGWRQMWNRAHLKVYRISALLAVTDNHLFPTILLEHVMWAYDLIMRDINIMTRRISEGDVGISDATRENKLLALCKTYLTSNLPASYGIPAQMHKDGVIPRKFFQSSTQRVSCFTGHKLGSTAAMDLSIRSLVDGGYLLELIKNESVQKYGFHGKCYRILSLPVGRDEAKLMDAQQQSSSH